MSVERIDVKRVMLHPTVSRGFHPRHWAGSRRRVRPPMLADAPTRAVFGTEGSSGGLPAAHAGGSPGGKQPILTFAAIRSVPTGFRQWNGGSRGGSLRQSLGKNRQVAEARGTLEPPATQQQAMSAQST